MWYIACRIQWFVGEECLDTILCGCPGWIMQELLHRFYFQLEKMMFLLTLVIYHLLWILLSGGGKDHLFVSGLLSVLLILLLEFVSRVYMKWVPDINFCHFSYLSSFYETFAWNSFILKLIIMRKKYTILEYRYRKHFCVLVCGFWRLGIIEVNKLGR
jgi:hypothetical protein